MANEAKIYGENWGISWFHGLLYGTWIKEVKDINK